LRCPIDEEVSDLEPVSALPAHDRSPAARPVQRVASFDVEATAGGLVRSGFVIVGLIDVGEKRRPCGLPTEMFAGERAGGWYVGLRKEGQRPEVVLRFVACHAHHGKIQSTADDLGDVFEQHCLFCDGYQAPATLASRARRYTLAASMLWTAAQRLSPLPT